MNIKALVFFIFASMVFTNNLYAKGAKSSASKSSLSSKSAVSKAPAANSNAAAAPAANAPAQKPSLLQSAMPALVGGAVGSYMGSKLAEGGNAEKSAEEKENKKDDQILKP